MIGGAAEELMKNVRTMFLKIEWEASTPEGDTLVPLGMAVEEDEGRSKVWTTAGRTCPPESH